MISSDKKIANEETKHKLREGLRQQSLSKLITLAYYIIVQRKKIILSLFSFQYSYFNSICSKSSKLMLILRVRAVHIKCFTAIKKEERKML